MPDDSSLDDALPELDRMARQACCLAECLRRGEVDNADWLVREIAAELQDFQKPD